MIRKLDVRFDVYRDNAKIAEILPTDRAPMIRMKRNADIKTSLSGDFLRNNKTDWLTDEIRPVLIIDGEEYRTGVFNVVTATDKNSDTSKIQKIEAYDRCWKVQTAVADDLYSIPAGTKYITAVESLLTAAGISDVFAQDSDLELAEIREWDIGTSYLEIINTLLKEINYEGLWFDEIGTAMIQPIQDPVDKNVQHRYDAAQVKSMMLSDVSSEMDLYDQPNRFVCICANPDKTAVMKYIAINDDNSSRLSTTRRGRTITKLIKLDNIASQEELQKYAENLCRESKYQTEIINLMTAIMPGHGVGDVCSISTETLSGICLETSYELELVTGGNMNHIIEREVLS